MTFDKFSGDKKNIPNLRKNLILTSDLCVSQQPCVLKSYLKDEVKEEVDNVKDNYEEIWKRSDENIKEDW